MPLTAKPQIALSMPELELFVETFWRKWKADHALSSLMPWEELTNAHKTTLLALANRMQGEIIPRACEVFQAIIEQQVESDA